jgi:aldose 1-epimerase
MASYFSLYNLTRRNGLVKLWLAIAMIAALGIGSVEMSAATKLTHGEFGRLHDGTPVAIYTLTNGHGVEARITTYGGRLVGLLAPDRTGTKADVILGFDSVDGYVANPGPFFGALIGRYGNRIGGAKFSIDGVEYKVDKNDGANSLHGGAHGFDKRVWTAKELPDGGLELTYLSKDGEEGYPGNLKATVTYHLSDANELKIDYRATTDKTTVVNLTNHAYFNLKGAGSGDILGHVMMISANRYTPVDSGLIPTGELRSVDGTPFDFRKPTAIGGRIGDNDEQLKLGKGYDHNWVLNRQGNGLQLAARVEEPLSGRVLEVLTTEPGVQFYTGNFLDGTIKAKAAKIYGLRSGFCLETQHFPDSPNKPQFPTTMLKPGEQYRSTTIFKLSTHP